MLITEILLKISWFYIFQYILCVCWSISQWSTKREKSNEIIDIAFLQMRRLSRALSLKDHFPPKFFLPKWRDCKREKSYTTLSNDHVPPHPLIFLPFYFLSSIQAWWRIIFSLHFSFLSIFSPPIFFPLPFSLHPSRTWERTEVSVSWLPPH